MHLTGVLASLQVSSAEHGVVNHTGVGVIAVFIREDGDVQALQLVAVSSCTKKTEVRKAGRMYCWRLCAT